MTLDVIGLQRSNRTLKSVHRLLVVRCETAEVLHELAPGEVGFEERSQDEAEGTLLAQHALSEGGDLGAQELEAGEKVVERGLQESRVRRGDLRDEREFRFAGVAFTGQRLDDGEKRRSEAEGEEEVVGRPIRPGDDFGEEIQPSCDGLPDQEVEAKVVGQRVRPERMEKKPEERTERRRVTSAEKEEEE
jgi:hypothetical protein